MGRNRRQSPVEDIIDIIADALKMMPFWFGPVLALGFFLLLKFLLPALMPVKHAPGADLAAISRPIIFTLLSWAVPGIVLLAWITAEIWKFSNRRLLDKQTGLDSLKNISWREFEHLVSEAYRRKGYLSEVVGNSSGDGGIDIELTGHGKKLLVQCKQWKVYTVGVTKVCELLGVVVSEKANGGILATSGRFTSAAIAFARRNPQIELVDGLKLAELIRGVQTSPKMSPPPNPISAPPPSSIPLCPQCGFKMVLRTAQKGPNSGSKFWGCSKYPACRGTRQIMDEPQR